MLIRIPRTEDFREIERWRLNLKIVASNYIPKVIGAIAGNLSMFTAAGALEDSLISADDVLEVGDVLPTTNQITVQDNLDGTITISIPSGAVINFSNTGLSIKDTDGSHSSTISVGSNLTADRDINLITGDADRTITINGNVTLDDWFNQAVKTTSSPTFATLTTNGARHLKRTRITDLDSPYSVAGTDHIIFCNTNNSPVVVVLPAGSVCREIKIINTGSSGNSVEISPDGSEQIYGGGAGISVFAYDGESVMIHFDDTEYWW